MERNFYLEFGGQGQHTVTYSPILAQILGQPGAQLFRFIDYWVNINSKDPAKAETHAHDGVMWFYMTEEEIQRQQLPHLSLRTVKTTIATLEAFGVVHSTDKYSANYFRDTAKRRTKWYTVNPFAFNAMMALWHEFGCPRSGARGEEGEQFKAFLDAWSHALPNYNLFTIVQSLHEGHSANFARRFPQTIVQSLHYLLYSNYNYTDITTGGGTPPDAVEDSDGDGVPAKQKSCKTFAQLHAWFKKHHGHKKTAIYLAIARWYYEESIAEEVRGALSDRPEKAMDYAPQYDNAGDKLKRSWLLQASRFFTSRGFAKVYDATDGKMTGDMVDRWLRFKLLCNKGYPVPKKPETVFPSLLGYCTKKLSESPENGTQPQNEGVLNDTWREEYSQEREERQKRIAALEHEARIVQINIDQLPDTDPFKSDYLGRLTAIQEELEGLQS